MLALFSRFRGAVGLIGGMRGPERRVSFQFPIDAQNDRIRAQIDVETACVEHLRYEATIGQTDFIANAKLAGRCRQQLLDRTEPARYPVLRPFLLLFLPDVYQHDQILQRLNAGSNDLEARFRTKRTLDSIPDGSWPGNLPHKFRALWHASVHPAA